MKKLIPVHHTLADWDFRHGATYRSLSAAQFISAPTSLRFLNATAINIFDTVLCRLPATQCLPQGEVRTWVYGYDINFRIASFRNQAPLGTANWANSYQLILTSTQARLYRYIDGAYSHRSTTSCQAFSNTWTHYRIFWYNGETPAGVAALCVDLYREIAGEWVKEGSTMYDTANTFKDSETNRCGFEGNSYNNQLQYFDDTEIWGPV